MGMNPRLLRPTASGFDPRRIANLSLWLDASDSSTITLGTGVATWADKSGLGRNASQSVGNEQPALIANGRNGRSVLRFDGSDDTMDLVSTPARTVLAVTLHESTNLLPALLNQVTPAVSLRRVEGNGGWRFTGNIGDFTGGNASSEFYINGAAGATVARQVWHVLSALRASALADISFTSVCRETAVAGRNYGGDVAEIIIYSRLLSSAERRSVESYLGRKWGITVT
jgi:hypothetical protein